MHSMNFQITSFDIWKEIIKEKFKLQKKLTLSDGLMNGSMTQTVWQIDVAASLYKHLSNIKIAAAYSLCTYIKSYFKH